ncbi:MAG: DUF3108 domain-containing protein, partial [Bacteroidales bacterium]
IKHFFSFVAGSYPKMKRLALLISIFILLHAIPAEAEEVVNPDRFGNHEYLSFKVFYNLGFIWIDAGKVDFKLSRQQQENRDVFHIMSTGISNPNWDWLYTLCDTFEVNFEADSFRPINFRRNTSEGRKEIQENYHFDYEQHQLYIERQSQDSLSGSKNINLDGKLYDILTATYVARSMDFTYAIIGDTVSLPLVHEGEKIILPIVFKGKETIQNLKEENVSCFRFSAVIKTGSLFMKGETVDVWVSADNRQVPVSIEAKIVIGSIRVLLDETLFQ